MLSTALVAYALGSFPTAYLVGRFTRGIDLREAGEGNVGARNAFHEVGPWWGIAVTAVDIGKGAAVALLYGRSPLWQLSVGAAFLVIGHAYPVWLRFVGGKGVACAGGLSAALFPWSALVGAGASGIAWLLTRRFLPTLVTMCVLTFALAPLFGYQWPVMGVAFGAFALVAVKRVIDEPRMRRIEAETGWDRARGGTRV
ncbi:MAG: glycerol-3-phosphate acyltransferase [Acidimicrobiia bacterium]|nr:glycerol-3-phosphate acyltransferase [Acidimicrobiia bacterium]